MNHMSDYSLDVCVLMVQRQAVFLICCLEMQRKDSLVIRREKLVILYSCDLLGVKTLVGK